MLLSLACRLVEETEQARKSARESEIRKAEQQQLRANLQAMSLPELEGFLGHDAPAVLALHDMKKENQSQLQKSHTQSSQAHIHMAQDMLQQSEHVHQAVLDSAMHHCRQLHDKDVALIMAGAANISPAVQVSAMDTSGVPGPHVSAVDGHDGRSWRPWMSLAGGGPAPTYTLPATTTVCTSQHHHGPTAVAGHAGHRLADDVLEVAGAIRQSLGAGSSFSVEEITRAARQVTAQLDLAVQEYIKKTEERQSTKSRPPPPPPPPAAAAAEACTAETTLSSEPHVQRLAPMHGQCVAPSKSHADVTDVAMPHMLRDPRDAVMQGQLRALDVLRCSLQQSLNLNDLPLVGLAAGSQGLQLAREPITGDCDQQPSATDTHVGNDRTADSMLCEHATDCVGRSALSTISAQLAAVHSLLQQQQQWRQVQNSDSQQQPSSKHLEQQTQHMQHQPSEQAHSPEQLFLHTHNEQQTAQLQQKLQLQQLQHATQGQQQEPQFHSNACGSSTIADGSEQERGHASPQHSMRPPNVAVAVDHGVAPAQAPSSHGVHGNVHQRHMQSPGVTSGFAASCSHTLLQPPGHVHTALPATAAVPAATSTTYPWPNNLWGQQQPATYQSQQALQCLTSAAASEGHGCYAGVPSQQDVAGTTLQHQHQYHQQQQQHQHQQRRAQSPGPVGNIWMPAAAAVAPTMSSVTILPGASPWDWHQHHQQHKHQQLTGMSAYPNHQHQQQQQPIWGMQLPLQYDYAVAALPSQPLSPHTCSHNQTEVESQAAVVAQLPSVAASFNAGVMDQGSPHGFVAGIPAATSSCPCPCHQRGTPCLAGAGCGHTAPLTYHGSDRPAVTASQVTVTAGGFSGGHREHHAAEAPEIRQGRDGPHCCASGQQGDLLKSVSL
eukprot:jgi/Chrzof1/15134/Cz09g28130.t1